VVGDFLPVAVWTAHSMCVREGRNMSETNFEFVNLGSRPAKKRD
jgi:hypothetical protein